MSTATETRHTAKPRERDRLERALQAITGRALTEVRITRTRWSDDDLHWVAMALTPGPVPGAAPREAPLAQGGDHRRIGQLLGDAFPHADWNAAQDYDVTAGVLTEHVTHMPMRLRGDEL
ncbi:hypothetical protein [Streptomyces sp. NPDC004528]|uniref:hypothetical protein n=1 Tax=Streptomyces sp. NPDC004528 TaxID=3154550 RepID=UPI0033B9CE8A